MDKNRVVTNRGLAQMLKGGVIMDVTTAEQACVAQAAGAIAVMALERVPADIRKAGGVARMCDPLKVKEIQEAVKIPVMAKCRIGHITEARVLEALHVDYIDESEVLTPADEENHIDKLQFEIPFVCGCRNRGEALRRISEGASMIRTKGEAGTGKSTLLKEIGKQVITKNQNKSKKTIPNKLSDPPPLSVVSCTGVVVEVVIGVGFEFDSITSSFDAPFSVTFRVTVLTELSKVPSLTTYRKLSFPIKFAVGV